MAYDAMGEGALDYSPCRYGASRLLFRGPRQTLDRPYVAALGGSETYGRYVETPLPAKLAVAIGRPVVNLGCVNAGLDVVMRDESVMGICRNAAATVIEVTGAQNISNAFYSVHPRRNDRFVNATDKLHDLFGPIDLTHFNFTRHLLAALSDRSAERFATFRQELQDHWVARMRDLIAAIGGPVVLLWLADRRPDDPCDDWAGSDPLFVDRAMLDEVSGLATATVEVVAARDEIEAGFRRMVFAPLEELAAREMLGPVVQDRAAAALRTTLAALL